MVRDIEQEANATVRFSESHAALPADVLQETRERKDILSREPWRKGRWTQAVENGVVEYSCEFDWSGTKFDKRAT